jgi:hypothetical protein
MWGGEAIMERNSPKMNNIAMMAPMIMITVSSFSLFSNARLMPKYSH